MIAAAALELFFSLLLLIVGFVTFALKLNVD